MPTQKKIDELVGAVGSMEMSLTSTISSKLLISFTTSIVLGLFLTNEELSAFLQVGATASNCLKEI